MGDSKSKVAVFAGIAAVLMLAAVIAAAVIFSRNGEENEESGKPGVTSKAVKLVCSPTDYKETCEKTLAGANTTDPKKLIEAAFDATVGSITEVLKSSALLKKAATDPSTKGAFDVCDEVLENAVDDLRSSIQKVESLDGGKAKAYIADLRTRLAAVGDDQETCIDAFENTTGDTGEKMKELLKTAKEMASNGLAMVTDLTKILGSLQLSKVLGSGGGGGASGARKLMAEEYVERRIQQVAEMKPTMVVAQDGSGQFKTIADAVKTLPPKNNETLIVILIKAGVYAETVILPKKVNKVVLLGEGPTKTIITGNLNFAAGVKTYHTATVG